MKALFKTLFATAPFFILLFLSSCEMEDPGPIQETTRSFSFVDFERLEMSNALRITVKEAATFSISATGDRRNISDLIVLKSGNTLVVKFKQGTNRQHDTYVNITMPRLHGVNFSGASISTISGFSSDGGLDIYLSGASVAQLDAGYKEVKAVLSGASSLVMRGLGDELVAEISGASTLTAFDYPVREVAIQVSGASHGKVTTTDYLTAHAVGASSVLYEGNPTVNATTSGASTVRKN